MRKFFIAVVISTMVLGGWLGVALAQMNDGSAIRIVSPRQGDTVGDTFELKYEVRKGLEGTHAHVHLDGKYQKGFDGTFQGVAKGEHEISVQVATKDHKGLAASEAITVTVK